MILGRSYYAGITTLVHFVTEMYSKQRKTYIRPSTVSIV